MLAAHSQRRRAGCVVWSELGLPRVIEPEAY